MARSDERSGEDMACLAAWNRFGQIVATIGYPDGVRLPAMSSRSCTESEVIAAYVDGGWSVEDAVDDGLP